MWEHRRSRNRGQGQGPWTVPSAVRWQHQVATRCRARFAPETGRMRREPDHVRPGARGCTPRTSPGHFRAR